MKTEQKEEHVVCEQDMNRASVFWFVIGGFMSFVLFVGLPDLLGNAEFTITNSATTNSEPPSPPGENVNSQAITDLQNKVLQLSCEQKGGMYNILGTESMNLNTGEIGPPQQFCRVKTVNTLKIYTPDNLDWSNTTNL